MAAEPSHTVYSMDTNTDSPLRAPVSAPPPPANAPIPANSGRTVQQSPAAAAPSPTRDKFVDEFGFELPDENALHEELRHARTIDGVVVERREIKWTNMAGEWEVMMKKKFEKVKERARKGIPTKVRGVIWQLLCSSRARMDSPENLGVYRMLVQKRLPNDVESLIEKDIGRTFPTHVLFRDQDGIGQTHLRNVLHAYAAIDPEVAYVQGMGFIVGTLLTQMTEEESFWCLHQLMHQDTYRMRELYRPGFPMLQMFFFTLKRLIAKCIPKVGAHFDAVNCDMTFFAAQWFLTLCVYHFSFRAVLRVWDIFLCEGWKIVFRVVLALLKWEEKELLTLPLEHLLPRLKTLHEGKNPDEIIERSLKIKFTTEDLRQLRLEWERGGGV